MAAFKESSPWLTQGDVLRLHELFEERIDRHLDAGSGACWMRQAGVADVVRDALLFFDGERYRLNAWAVLPNHVHVVVQPRDGVKLSSVLHSWKSFTAKEVNKLLARTGQLWQSESWDHLVRDEGDFLRCVGYTVGNPERAGLRGWTWVGKNLMGR